MTLSCRQDLTTFGAVAAGQALLADAVAQERNPAAQVADRSSTIKIAKMRASWVGPTFHVRIETNRPSLATLQLYLAATARAVGFTGA